MGSKAKDKKNIRRTAVLILALAAVFFSFLLSTAVGSVSISFKDTVRAFFGSIFNADISDLPSSTVSIIINSRLPRVIAAGLSGALLALSGAAMQGLLKNPLADGSTLGVASGASLGAVSAIALTGVLPVIPSWGVKGAAALGAFIAIILILSFALRLDATLSSQTVILIGMVFSMFVSSVISLITALFPERMNDIFFWTFGSFSGKEYKDDLTLLIALVFGAIVMLLLSTELNALSIGEDNAGNIGVDVKKVRIFVLLAVSVMIGLATASCGQIAFVGLIVPHLTRRLTGPDHRILLPASMAFGACFLMLSDLIARTVLRPRELPVGVVTSLFGAVLFVIIFYSMRKRGKA